MTDENDSTQKQWWKHIQDKQKRFDQCRTKKKQYAADLNQSSTQITEDAQLMSFDNLKIWTCGIKESNNGSEQEHQNCEIKQWSRPQQRHSKVNETWYHYCRQKDMVQTQSTMSQQWQCTKNN